ncbi:MAG: two-component regulator propeller domain-containing protein [Dysgonomonas sp.]
MKIKIKLACIYIIIFLCSIHGLYGYNLRQISSRDGLSNSAILSLYQDKDGFMWFGTCDGLNMFDGINIKIYKPNKQTKNGLSGNLIQSISETADGTLWLNTNYGLNKLDEKSQSIEYHKQFIGNYRLALDKNRETFIVKDNSKCFFYLKDKHIFREIPLQNINFKAVYDFFIDDSETMWILGSEGKIFNARIRFHQNTELPTIEPLNNFNHPSKILYMFHGSNMLFFVDETYALYEYNTITRKLVYIKNLTEEIKNNGKISSIIKDKENYYVAFQTNGLIFIHNTPDQLIKYESTTIDIQCGIFSMVKDKNQDVVWIGTDGQGVYMLSQNYFSLRTFTYNYLPFNISKPTRSLFVDRNNTLWVGTKDDGILKFPNYTIEGDPRTKKVEHLTTNNSALINNSIYAFAPSKKNIVWIGSDGGGLNYYSYRDNMIHFINYHDNNSIRYIHSLCETNDTTLWIATVGLGIIKATISGTPDNPTITNLYTLPIDKNIIHTDHYFAVYKENDSILWFGNRGYGAIRLNTYTEKYEVLKFNLNNIQTINDIFCIHKSEDGMFWFGTSFGLTKLISRKSNKINFLNYNENIGFTNNTIHGILEDSRKNLWMSTNSGIIEFNPQTESLVKHNQSSGLNIVEFSDGAYFKDENTGNMYFGGINGFVSIKEDEFTASQYAPPIIFNDIRIYEKDYDVSDLLNSNGELELHHNQDFFTISFIAIDYINGANYTYQYKLDNLKDYWINNGNSNSVTFTNLSPGTYTLLVKYKNGISNTESQVYSIKIRILPPWYMSAWAYLVYCIIAIGIVYYTVGVIQKRQNNKRKILMLEIEQKQKEEVYESKLSFFTNITHELCTPLTLIYGPCHRIISYEKSDAYIKKYSFLILRNVERLNDLIQDLIEFRRLDTDNKKYDIKLLSISDISKDITDSFSDMSDSRNIRYNVNIQNHLSWPSDKAGFTTILTNLVSNAFKYTPDAGTISINVAVVDEYLQIIVSNTGKGIKAHDIDLIFDRYQILDNLEKQSMTGASRNGLGLAICHNTVKLLNGDINVKSTPNLSTEFIVTLPQMPVSSTEDSILLPEEKDFNIISENTETTSDPLINTEYTFDKSRPSIMIIDDDPDMLWFISDIFVEKYNIIPINDSTKVSEFLQQMHPELIISDIMMPNIDGITLTKLIKQDKQTAHIPIILLSAKQYVEEQIKGIESGADIYLTKPFNVDYIKTVVDQFIKRKEDLKDYYNSSLSSFELTNGKLLHKEEKEFVDKMIEIINENITNTDLSTEFVASAMGLGVRNLYRRLKGIVDKTPADIIKEYRLNIAEHLLIKSNMSIDEIIYKSGFSNRATFFKLFSGRFGCTPKNYREQKKNNE